MVCGSVFKDRHKFKGNFVKLNVEVISNEYITLHIFEEKCAQDIYPLK